MSQSTNQGSQAVDFQPTTQNPQGNVGGGLQPNSANLQPISPTNGSNVFNQPGINPQAFPQTTNLRVAGSQATRSIANTSTPDQASNSPSWGTFSVFFVVAAILIIGLLVIVKFAKPAPSDQDKEESRVVPNEAVGQIVSQSKPKKKPKPKKRNQKKRR